MKNENRQHEYRPDGWFKEHFLARVGIVLCSVIYSFVILWHCCGAYYILGD